MDFVHNNIELLRQRLSDESWVLNLLYAWYDAQMLLLNKWLMERLVIVPIQAAAIKLIFKVRLISNVRSWGFSALLSSDSPSIPTENRNASTPRYVLIIYSSLCYRKFAAISI